MLHVMEEWPIVSSGSSTLEGSLGSPIRREKDGKDHKSLAVKATLMLVSPTVDCGEGIIISTQRWKLDIVPIPALSATQTVEQTNMKWKGERSSL